MKSVPEHDNAYLITQREADVILKHLTIVEDKLIDEEDLIKRREECKKQAKMFMDKLEVKE